MRRLAELLTERRGVEALVDHGGLEVGQRIGSLRMRSVQDLSLTGKKIDPIDPNSSLRSKVTVAGTKLCGRS